MNGHHLAWEPGAWALPATWGVQPFIAGSEALVPTADHGNGFPQAAPCWSRGPVCWRGRPGHSGCQSSKEAQGGDLRASLGHRERQSPGQSSWVEIGTNTQGKRQWRGRIEGKSREPAFPFSPGLSCLAGSQPVRPPSPQSTWS